MLLRVGGAYPQTRGADHDGITIFAGQDVHKKTIAVATVEARASAEVCFLGTIVDTPVDAEKLAKGGQKLHLASLEVGLSHWLLFRAPRASQRRTSLAAATPPQTLGLSHRERNQAVADLADEPF